MITNLPEEQTNRKNAVVLSVGSHQHKETQRKEKDKMEKRGKEMQNKCKKEKTPPWIERAWEGFIRRERDRRTGSVLVLYL